MVDRRNASGTHGRQRREDALCVGADLHVDPMRGLDCPHHCRCRVRLRQGKLHDAGIDSLRGAERIEDLGEVPDINIRQNKERFDRPPDQWRPRRAFEPVDVSVIAGERVLVATDHELGAEGSRIPAHGDPQNHMSIPVGAVGAQPLNSGLPSVAHDGERSIVRRNRVDAVGHDDFRCGCVLVGLLGGGEVGDIAARQCVGGRHDRANRGHAEQNPSKVLVRHKLMLPYRPLRPREYTYSLTFDFTLICAVSVLARHVASAHHPEDEQQVDKFDHAMINEARVPSVLVCDNDARRGYVLKDHRDMATERPQYCTIRAVSPVPHLLTPTW